MNSGRHDMATRKKAFSWLLMLAFLSLAVFPYHYHLHHVDAHDGVRVAAPVHVLDTHFYTGSNESDDHSDQHMDGHDNSHTIESSSDITIKSSTSKLPLLALLFTISLLLLFSKREKLLRLAPLDRKRPSFNPYHTPPLRAPPRP